MIRTQIQRNIALASIPRLMGLNQVELILKSHLNMSRKLTELGLKILLKNVQHSLAIRNL